MTRTDPSRHDDLNEIIARIDALVSPIALEEAHRLDEQRLALLRKRFEHTLIDLDLGPACGVHAVVVDGNIAIRTKKRRSAEFLLRVLEYHADHHRWGSTRW